MIGKYGTAQRFTGQVWGNGEFGLTVQKSFDLSVSLRRQGGEERQRSLYRPILPDLRETVHGNKEGSYERVDVCLAMGRATQVEVSKETFDNLGLSPHVNSHSRAKRGSKGISRYATKLTRNACLELEKRYGKDRISFVTLTLPPMSSASLSRVIERWGDIVRVFHQWLRRTLIRCGLPPHVVGVTEIQSKRFQQSGFLGYHLHFAVIGRQRRGAWVIRCEEFREAWKRALSPHLVHPSDVECWSASTRVERVLYSLEGYLGKYLTKGAREVATVSLVHGEKFLVSSWHTISRELKELVLRERYKGNGQVMTFLCELCESAQQDVFLWLRKIHILVDGKEIPWGWAGKLTKFGMACIKDFLSVR